MTFGLRIVCESAEMRASATVTCRLSAMRNVFVGGLLRNSSPEPPLVRPSHSVMVTVAGRLSAIHTDTSLGSTRRRIGPARTKGSDTKVPPDAHRGQLPRAFSWCCGSSAGNAVLLHSYYGVHRNSVYSIATKLGFSPVPGLAAVLPIVRRFAQSVRAISACSHHPVSPPPFEGGMARSAGVACS